MTGEMINRNYDPCPRFFNIGKEPVVGHSVSLVNTLMDCAGQIIIGNFVSFGHDCKLLTAKHDYSLMGAERQLKYIIQPITIKDGVWLASNVTVLGGVTIGENAVVGANSLVTKDIPPNEVWFGVPAKFRKRIEFVGE